MKTDLKVVCEDNGKIFQAHFQTITLKSSETLKAVMTFDPNSGKWFARLETYDMNNKLLEKTEDVKLE